MTTASRVCRCVLLCWGLSVPARQEVYAAQLANARVTSPAVRLAAALPASRPVVEPRAIDATPSALVGSGVTAPTGGEGGGRVRAAFELAAAPAEPDLLARTIASARSTMAVPTWIEPAFFVGKRMANVHRRRVLEHIDPSLGTRDTLYCVGISVRW